MALTPTNGKNSSNLATTNISPINSNINQPDLAMPLKNSLNRSTPIIINTPYNYEPFTITININFAENNLPRLSTPIRNDSLSSDVDNLTISSPMINSKLPLNNVSSLNNDSQNISSFQQNLNQNVVQRQNSILTTINQSNILPVPSLESNLSQFEQPTEQSLKLLKQYFGFENFRPHQWEIIWNVLNNFDQVVIMSTG